MQGSIVAVFGNILVAEFSGAVMQSSIAECIRPDGARLLAEVIRVRGNRADLQCFEEVRGLKIGDAVEFFSRALSVELGPGLLGQVFDGLQNRLPDLAKGGWFLDPGRSARGLDIDRLWHFTPTVTPGQEVYPGTTLGTVPEGPFIHRIMVPLAWDGAFTVSAISPSGTYSLTKIIATLIDANRQEYTVTMAQPWPVKRALCRARRRLLPTRPLVTSIRIVDTMFPIVHGGTFCVPGPFGAGKTVLQHLTAKYADVDIVIIAACGERAGEVVETIREFPEITDPRTGRKLMERTIIICNTSAMPVAAREASVYTAVTMAEYYRQMGRNVLLLADSTSRWAQAMREVSGRLEEIPGEEAFPAYLESRIAGFYERAGAIELPDGSQAAVTIGGTVSPAGGNFEEPVTQGTLKVVGAFHGLSRARSDARRFPAIDPIESWSKYPGIIATTEVAKVRVLLERGNEVKQMLAVVGEEGTPPEDFAALLLADFFDNVYLQQNAFDNIDAATIPERQRHVFNWIVKAIAIDLTHLDRSAMRRYVVELTDLFRNWNYTAWQSPEFQELEARIAAKIAAV